MVGRAIVASVACVAFAAAGACSGDDDDAAAEIPQGPNVYVTLTDEGDCDISGLGMNPPPGPLITRYVNETDASVEFTVYAVFDEASTSGARPSEARIVNQHNVGGNVRLDWEVEYEVGYYQVECSPLATADISNPPVEVDRF